MNHAQFWGGAAAPYEIEQSLRFDGSSHLNRTPSSAGTTTTWTFSCWLKLAGTSEGCPIAAAESGGYTALFHSVGGEAHFRLSRYVGSNQYAKSTTSRYRDPSGWYHLVTVFDSTNSTASDRIRYYVNGVRLTDFSNDGSSVTNVDPGLNAVSAINSNTAQRIGSQFDGTYAFLKGYMAEAHMLDGTAVTDALDFGEYDDNGVWRPIRVSGVTYGTNGYYLTFDPSATNGIGHDHSGNGNNFTASGFTTSGTGTDVMSDTPTTNWCTLNPIQGGNVSTFSNGNLDTVCNNASTSGGTIAVSSGKWYAEFVCTAKTAVNAIAGICTIDGFDADRQPNESLLGGFGTVYVMNGTYIQSGSAVSYGATWAVNDNIGIALDLDSAQNTVTFYKNGVSQGAINIPNAAYVFALGNGQASSTVTYTINFGQRAFAYTPPTGFNALNTSNLPAPDIADGSKYFGTLLYTADNSAGKTVTGLNFGAAPDFVWIKNRDNVESHHLMDVVRGNDAFLMSNRTDAERDRPYADPNDTTAFDFETDGFSFVSSNYNQGEIYFNNRTYVGWNWLAGGTGSSNTDGTITSTVSANPTAGFSIVAYTGDGNTSSGVTIGHGLGVTPDFIITKKRSTGTDYGWSCWHKDLGGNYGIWLNLTNGRNTSMWGGYSSFSSAVFTPPDLLYGNESGKDYINYCFAEVEGYSKFGSYTGNGSSDGPFVFCGFKPRWIMLKKSNGTANVYTSWSIYDTARDSYNVSDAPLYANVADQESTNSQGTVESGHNVDILSNGFKLRDSNQIRNTSGDTYIFAAFAENPFGGSGISPATAR